MTYTKYHTRAIILDTQENGESDRIFTLLTETHGVVRAVAKSVRDEKSKLRGGLAPYAVIRIGLIRARVLWRITDARIESGNTDLISQPARQVLARIYNLSNRLIDTGKSVVDVFDVLVEGTVYLQGQHISRDEIELLETILVMRLLHRLGYFGGGAFFEHITSSPYITDMVLTETARLRSRIVSQINRSMREIHL